MIFYCSACKARYSISDDRIPEGKMLKLACKRCKNGMRISRGQVFDGALLTLDAEEVKPAGQPASNSVGAPPPIMEDDGSRWFTLAGKKREGPFTRAQMMQRLHKGDIDKHTYTWKKGMKSWLRLGKIEDFQDVAQKRGTAPWRIAEPMDDEPSQAKVNKKQQDNPEDVALMSGLVGAPIGEGLSRDELAKSALQESPFESENPFEKDGDVADDTKKQTFQGSPPPAVKPTPSGPPPQAELVPKLPEAKGNEYFEAPPGEDTRMFMATAGIFKRRKKHKIAAVVASIVMVFLATFVVLDVSGAITIPGMGLVYDATGWTDPNADRAVGRIETKLKRRDLTPEERKKLREKLSKYGFGDPNQPKPKKQRKRTRRKKKPEKSQEYYEAFQEEKQKDEGKEKDLLAAMYSDKRKKEKKISMKSLAKNVSVSDLPSGLTREAITKVIGENVRSLKLCVAEAAKAGEKVGGRMEVEFTIHGSGRVIEASIANAKFKDTRMAACVARTVKRWMFPRFNGEPVTVAYPIMFSLGI